MLLYAVSFSPGKRSCTSLTLSREKSAKTFTQHVTIILRYSDLLIQLNESTHAVMSPTHTNSPTADSSASISGHYGHTFIPAPFKVTSIEAFYLRKTGEKEDNCVTP